MTLWNIIAFWRQNNNSTYFCIISVNSGKSFSTQSLILSYTVVPTVFVLPLLKIIHPCPRSPPTDSTTVILIRPEPWSFCERGSCSITWAEWKKLRGASHRCVIHTDVTIGTGLSVTGLNLIFSMWLLIKKQCYLLVCWKHAVVVDSCPSHRSPLPSIL